MPTPRTRILVSLAAAMTASLALGACAGAPSRAAAAVAEGRTVVEPRRSVIRFDNDALDPVDVYFLADGRQWRIGRVPPGGRAKLRLPAASLAGNTPFVQIAVIAGEGRESLPGRGGRMTLSIPQPATDMLAQRWRFADGQVRSMQLRGSGWTPR